ncbi:GNAT family N-acetyltransferase [Streptomyces sp. NPDC056227]|uniref:GNAT family N-acetyltransferase n=1 Tax=Streptomyces sp. NPDC056227 TaxID=3345753 RepID=UPI0035DC4B9E
MRRSANPQCGCCLLAQSAAPGPEQRAGCSRAAVCPSFAVREYRKVVAATGYQAWSRQTAHISVLTASDVRERGLARVTASATVTHALAAGLLPEWRARPPASRRVAAALGFEELGAQLSCPFAIPSDQHVRR